MKTIILRGLPDRMIWRILPDEITKSEIAYSGIGTVLLIMAEERDTLVVFEGKSEWNYHAKANVDELFGRLAGLK